MRQDAEEGRGLLATSREQQCRDRSYSSGSFKPANCDGRSSPLAWLGGERGDVAPEHTSLALPETNNEDGNILPGSGWHCLEHRRTQEALPPLLALFPGHCKERSSALTPSTIMFCLTCVPEIRTPASYALRSLKARARSSLSPLEMVSHRHSSQREESDHHTNLLRRPQSLEAYSL